MLAVVSPAQSLLRITSALLLASNGISSTYTVCVVIESGFSMLREDAAGSPLVVQSDSELRGFDVDMRELALAGVDCSVRVLPSYGEVEVRTRSGTCTV